MVLATGLPFETVAGLTGVQFASVQKAVRKHWEMAAAINGMQQIFGGGSSRSSTKETTRIFEKKVAAMKETSGRKQFDLYEVI